MKRHPIYGLLAEFDNPEDLLAAARRTHDAGYRKVDAFSPMPIEGLAEAVGFERTNLPLVVFIGGVIGCVAGFALQWWVNVVNLPLNIGGKPHNSWPSFIPITFELTVLAAALAATFGMLAMNGLPTPYHPVFNVPRFALATRDRFFLCIKAKDAKFELSQAKEFLSSLHPRGVYEIEA